ncbi:MAG TPA: alpha/beta hydrolase [Cellvibrionaceae bacterium]
MRTVFLLFSLLVSQVVCSEIKTAEIDGYGIEYEVLGSGNEFVLLEAGGGGGLADWNDIPEALSETATVIRYSRVGNGNSDKPETMFVVEDYASHLKSLLDHLGVGKIIHVAHSYGGSVARVFAAEYPGRVEGLLLVDASSEHDVDIMRAIDLEQANAEIEAVKLADIKGGKNYHIVDFWAKFPLPDYPQIKDIPVTVIASVKRYKSPAHLLHSDKGVAMWGEHWKNWADAFPQGKAVLTAKSHHLIPQEEPSLVVGETNELIRIVRANKSLADASAD